MPSRIRMWVKPISRTNSSFVCSLSEGIVFVTLNMLLMMSWEEYPRVLQGKSVRCTKSYEARVRSVVLTRGP